MWDGPGLCTLDRVVLCPSLRGDAGRGCGWNGRATCIYGSSRTAAWLSLIHIFRGISLFCGKCCKLYISTPIHINSKTLMQAKGCFDYLSFLIICPEVIGIHRDICKHTSFLGKAPCQWNCPPFPVTVMCTTFA